MSDFAAEEPSQTIDDNLGIVTYITLARIYDALCLIADGVGKGEEVLKMIGTEKTFNKNAQNFLKFFSLNLAVDSGPTQLDNLKFHLFFYLPFYY